MEADENKKGPHDNKVEEPFIEYKTASKTRLSVFSSFEEAAEADCEFYRKLTPEQRVNLHYEISLRTFGAPLSTHNRRFTF